MGGICAPAGSSGTRPATKALSRRLCLEPNIREVDRMMKKLVMIALLIGVVPLAACATVKGAGKDIQSVGQAGQDAINDK
jgi:predicted small secreted protein